MSLVARLRASRDDAGLTLIELLVAAMLFSLVAFVVGGIMISSLTAQRTVSGVTSSANTAQAAASNIDNNVRNASGYSLVANGSDQLLVARVAGRGSTLTWTCVAWYYSASQGSIRTTTGPVGTKIAVPTSAQLATWPTLTTAVTPRTGSTIFSDVDGTSVSVAFDVAGAGKKVTMQFTTSRPIGIAATTLAESDKCY